MGLGWSRRKDQWRQPTPYLPALPPSSSNNSSSSAAPDRPRPPYSNPPIPSFPPTTPQPPVGAMAAGPSYSQSQPPYPAAAPYPALAPAPPSGLGYCTYPQYAHGGCAMPPWALPGRSNYQHYGPGQYPSGWQPAPLQQHLPSSLPASAMPPPPPPRYVDRQKAVTVKNNVNLHKDTIRLVQDEQNPDQFLVCFTFDSLVDGSITIFYFAKEGEDCRFVPAYPDIYMPVSIPFQKGLGQKFCQPSGSGIDLGFFTLDDLSKASLDVFPLIVSAEALPEPKQTGEGPSKPSVSGAQITEAVIEKKGDSQFEVKVIKQILWVDGERYELKEIFGLADTAKAEGNKDDSGEECVICMTEPKNTAVLPCRHMCMCSECAKALRLQTNKCPICRQPVEELMEINVSSATAT